VDGVAWKENWKHEEGEDALEDSAGLVRKALWRE